MQLARYRLPAFHGLARELLTTEELHADAGLAGEVVHVEHRKQRQEALDPSTGLVEYLHVGRKRGAEAVQRRYGVWQTDVSGTAALDARLGHVRPDHRHPVQAPAGQRQ